MIDELLSGIGRYPMPLFDGCVLPALFFKEVVCYFDHYGIIKTLSNSIDGVYREGIYSMRHNNRSTYILFILVIGMMMVSCMRAEGAGDPETPFPVSSTSVVPNPGQQSDNVVTVPAATPVPEQVKVYPLTVEVGSAADHNDSIYDEEILVAYADWNCIALTSGLSGYEGLAGSLADLSSDVESHSAEAFSECREFYEIDSEAEREIPGLTYCVDDDLTVLRADTTLVSVLEYQYTDFGGAHPNYDFYGHNYDSASGRELSLKDITSEAAYPTLLAETVKKEYDKLYTASLVEDVYAWILECIENGSLAWTLTNFGLDIYFNCYELSSFAEGMQHVFLSFERYPDLFKEKYMLVAPAFVIGFVADRMLWVDLNDDGNYDEIFVNGDYYGDSYLSDLTVSVNGNDFTFSNIFGYDEVPYLVCSSDGKYYLYVSMTAANGAPLLNIYGISASGCFFIDSISGTPVSSISDSAWDYDHIYFDPTDFCLLSEHDFLGVTTETAAYCIGENGVPEKLDRFFVLNFDYVLTVAMECEAFLTDEAGAEKSEKIVLAEGDVITMKRFDGDRIADGMTADGRWIRFFFDEDGLWDRSFDGNDVDDLFIGIGYAG